MTEHRAATNSPLFDDLVGGVQQSRRDFEAQRGRGLAVDVQRKLGCVLNGQIAWLGALEDAAR